jgi:hypothetical protein
LRDHGLLLILKRREVDRDHRQPPGRKSRPLDMSGR